MERFPGLLALLGGMLAVSSCTTLPTDYPKTQSSAFRFPASTEVGGVFERAAKQHPGKSGFAVLPDNREAFTDRVALARFAEKTLDIQYFIWSSDTIGRMLGEQIIAAAERGVRVRFLLDDVNFKKRDSAAAALAVHPNIEIRIFNPHQLRSVRILEFGMNFSRLNKRMHNKIMVMDNACVIVGGRNIADEYFGLGEKQNNRDLDIVAVGPIVRDISNTFDEFWNSPGAIPIEALVRREYSLEDFRQQVAVMRKEMNPDRFPFPLEADLKVLRERITGLRTNFIWAPGRVMHDTFESMRKRNIGETVAGKLSAEIAKTRKELLIESAYFVVQDDGIEVARKLTGRGVHLRVLTNSLASNNVIAAQAGHAKRRKQLVGAGVDLYELRPDAASVMRQVAPHGMESVSTLHSKALVIDGKKAFVGSYNLDPRSAKINSEIGIMVESEAFARQVRDFLNEGVGPENSYHVVPDGRGNLRWETVVDGEARTWTKPPETGAFKRFKAGAIGLLPIEGQL